MVNICCEFYFVNFVTEILGSLPVGKHCHTVLSTYLETLWLFIDAVTH